MAKFGIDSNMVFDADGKSVAARLSDHDTSLDGLSSSLADSTSDLTARGINIMYPPVPLVGAKGNGTDETTVIQNIINSLVNKGGKLIIPLKTFYVQGLSITGNSTISIEGLGTLKLPNGATQNLFNVDIGNVHIFKGIVLDGNKSNVSSTVDGIHFNDYTGASTWQPSGIIDGVTITNFTGDCVYIGQVRCGGQIYKSTFINSGYGLKTPDNYSVADWMVENCQFGDNNYNIYGNFTAGQFIGNAIYRAKYTNVTLLAQTWYSWLIGNSIDTSQQVGLAINGDITKDNMNMIVANTFFGNSSSGDGLYSDITASNINLTNIVGNTFFLYAGSNKTKYALELLTSNNRVLTFSNNNFNSANFGSGVVSDSTKVYGYNAGLPFNIPENVVFKGSVNFNNNANFAPTNNQNPVQQVVVQGQAYPQYKVKGDGTLSWGSGTANPDVNFWRNSAGVLKTDSKLIANAGLGVGNSASATSLGTLSKKMEVFDSNGSSLGFVPIYTSIT